MGHLVRDLKGKSEIKLLPEIYKIVAKHLLAHRSRRMLQGDLASASFDDVCRIVSDTESMVPLVAAQEEANALLKTNGISGNPLIGKSDEKPGEMFNNLGQLEVLSKAVAYFEEISSCFFTACAPTQQHLDRDKQPIADLEGFICEKEAQRPWALEAFGGKDLQNNSKLYKDLSGLLKRKAILTNPQMFLAFRESAWTWQSKQRELLSCKTITMTGKPKGGKCKVTAQLRLFAKCKDVLIVEVTDLQEQEKS